MHDNFPSPYLDPHHDYNHDCHDDHCGSWLHDHCHDHHHAHECDDQLPSFSSVGRGIKGDSYRVRIVDPDTHEITQLIGESYDEATKTWHTEWMSENINGGFLEYQYHLRPYNVPATFTITFKYHRPGVHGFNPDGTRTERVHDTVGNFCGDGEPNDAYDSNGNKIENNVGLDDDNECSWVWTTPAIPYLWDETMETDHIVGSGCATLFTRTMHDLKGNPLTDAPKNWKEELIYPYGWTREHFNAPTVLQPWTVNLRFGYKGDVNVPDFYDISQIVGVPIVNITNLLDGMLGQIEGSDNIVDYIQDEIERLRLHIHNDMGYGDNLLGCPSGTKVPNSNNPATIANYIKAATTEVEAGENVTVDHEYGTNGQHIYTVNADLSAVADMIPEPAEPIKVEGGPGINVTYNNNIYTVSNTMAGDTTQLTPGVDYTYKFFNGWQCFVDVPDTVMGTVNEPTGPEIYLNLSKNGDEITGGTIQFDFYNQVRLVHPDTLNNVFGFSHGTPLDDYEKSAICGINFQGNYSDLNAIYILTNSSTCLWNLIATGSGHCSWPVFVELRRTSSAGKSKFGGCDFVLYATMIGDGINQQLDQTCEKWLSGTPCNVPKNSRANTRLAGLFTKKVNTSAIV